MEMTQTCRGFDVSEFTDKYGNKCSLQKSSAASEPCIWFGVDEIKPIHLVPDKGWTPVEFPEDTQFNSRMHLTQDQVKELLPFLQRFAETGELS
jgi:hypothetical protein